MARARGSTVAIGAAAVTGAAADIGDALDSGAALMAADLDLSDAGRSADSTVARAFTPSMVEAGSMVVPAFEAVEGSTAVAVMVADAGRSDL